MTLLLIFSVFKDVGEMKVFFVCLLLQLGLMFSNSSQPSQFVAVNNGFTGTSDCCAAVLVRHAGQLCLSVSPHSWPGTTQKCLFLIILKQLTLSTIQEADDLKTEKRFTTMY